MAVNNSLVTQEQAEKQLPFSQVINSVPYQKMISSTLKDRNTANRFVASIVSAVATTPALQTCTPKTIISAALLGEGLKLSPSPQLGQFYLVPFNQKEKKDKNGRVIQEACTNATFVLGYKGYIQLATRSGEYKHINAMPIKEGELNYFDPLNEEIQVNIIKDYEAREEAKTIGYYAYLEYMNGFRKALYWSKSQMENHALKYSTSYNRDIQKGTKYSYWSNNFEAMAYKTMLRQLLSKWGNLNPEMQMAIDGDMAVIHQDGTSEYIDNIVIDQEEEKPKELNNNIQNETIHNNQQMSIADALFS